MDYPLENLGPEKFQEFAQALLNKEFPNLQCFPVAQPDGGRDIITYEPKSSLQGFAIYQVKYVRKPLAEKDIQKWLLNIVKGELPKVEELIHKGAKSFTLITNIPGTAHPDVGSIDKMNQLFKELGIPSRCWWRDDINRKLDDAWNLKWVYPELMTGPDLIRSIIEFGLSEDKERRSNAIKAFIIEQFHTDQVVKFKQVELQNRLLNLFIDVPALPPQYSESSQIGVCRYLYEYISSHSNTTYQDIPNDHAYPYLTAHKKVVGSATLLLHPLTQDKVPWIVLEGAPGQGKSTITQYLCQVHRMRILGAEEIKKNLPESYKETEGLDVIPPDHTKSKVCLPFRIDLRDLASWLAGYNPFLLEEKEQQSSGFRKSLEEFLAFLVSHHSGGFDFSVVDLIAIFKTTPVLLVFDGLDEVADIGKRREVVETIRSGSRRLKANTLDLQIIVTSRPAAFSNSPGLPDSEFPRYYLDSLTKPLIFEYANKWMDAKNLDQRDRKDVKKILQDKLDQPHLKDLAKNPMQLTILLSLIYNRGSSLPDKRTTLYDSYVDLFFNREAEKTPVVKTHRDLLLGIHKYIAWILHSEAEQLGTSGSITQSALHDKIQEYLASQGYETNLASELVTGALERIVALVSRVEGTYEFEVQPLREYFAARYLYETAPYSSPGNTCTGTKPERFDAIARNFYWLNVTRFYAGCYDVGELPSLIDRLEELIEFQDYRFISHPRVLASILLSDWVFSQHPKSVKKVIRLILDGIGLRYVLPSVSRRMGQHEPMVLSSECGRDELIKHCFNLLNEQPSFDFALDILDLIIANISSPKDIFDLWLSNIMKYESNERTQWLRYGLHLGIVPQSNILSLDTLINICSDSPQNSDRLNLLYHARRFDYLEDNEERFKSCIELLLNNRLSRVNNRKSKKFSLLEAIAYITDAKQYAFSFQHPQPVPLASPRNYYISASYRNNLEENIAELEYESSLTYEDSTKCLEIIELIKGYRQLDAHVWATDLTPWNNLVESIRKSWGDKWICFHLANIASGIKSSTETYTEFPELLQHSKELCKRVRYARLRAGQYSWWVKQLDVASEELDQALLVLVLFTWASSKTLKKIVVQLDQFIQEFSDSTWVNVYESIVQALKLCQPKSSVPPIDTSIGNSLSPRTIVLLSLRVNPKNLRTLYCHLNNYDGSDKIILKVCYGMSLELLASDYETWNEVRDVIKRNYSKGIVFEPYTFHRLRREVKFHNLPEEVALEIVSNPGDYPGFLVAIAEMKIRAIVASNVVPVGEVALQNKWFEEI